MNDRTETILRAAVEEFIKNGEPITSTYLYDRYNFGIKPAMIRWELNDLANQGYLFQEHTSSGRMPTDKAYRFFVSVIEEEDASEDWVEGITRSNSGIEGMLHELVKELNVFSVYHNPYENEIYEEGLTALCESFGGEKAETLLEVIRDIELLDERLKERKRELESRARLPRVFIGHSPITENDHCSVIIDEFGEKDRKCTLLFIGPKRMDYRKSIAFFKYLKEETGEGEETKKGAKRNNLSK